MNYIIYTCVFLNVLFIYIDVEWLAVSMLNVAWNIHATFENWLDGLVLQSRWISKRI